MNDDKQPKPNEKLEIKIAEARRAHDRHEEMLRETRRFAIEASALAVRTMMLINGAAVIAMLTLVGALESSAKDAVSSAALVLPVKWFAFGVGSAALAAGLSYIVNVLDSDQLSSCTYTYDHPYILDNETSARRKLRFSSFAAAFICGVAAIVFFFWGVFGVVGTLSDLKI